MKKALITGITGQDGAHLSKLLLDKGYEVYGALRRSEDMNIGKLRYLGIDSKIKFVPFELADFSNIYKTIETVQPDEIYNLAAQTSIRLAFEEPGYTTDINGFAVFRLLEAIRSVNPKIKFFQASSSDVFGKPRVMPQNETTPFNPINPFGTAKAFGYWTTVNYRESYDIFACSGILFDHDSPLRVHQSVPGLIVNAAIRIKQGLQDKLTLGNIDFSRDLGYASEYTEAMWLMLQQEKADDYVIATGETHTVREFIETAFDSAGITIEWSGKGQAEKGIDSNTGKTLVTLELHFPSVNPASAAALIRSHSDVFIPSKGDYAKAKRSLGWEPKVKYKELFKMMIDYELKP